MTSKDIVYFNGSSVSIGENPCIYQANLQQPIITDADTYTMAIVRASIDRSKIPVWIPKMQYNNTPTATAYTFQVIANMNGTNYIQLGRINFINSYGINAPAISPPDQRSVTQNQFYWTYDLNEFITMFNQSMATAWQNLQSGAGSYTVKTKPPILVLNGNIFSIYFDTAGFSYDNAHGAQSENFTISFNYDLRYLLDNFNYSYQNSPYPYLLNFGNVTSTYVNPITTKTYLVFTQSYQALSLFSPVENIVFLSDIGDYRNDQLGSINILGTNSLPAMANNIESQVTDIDLDAENPMDWTGMIIYSPQQYRYINIDNSMTIKQIKFRMQWKSRYSDYYDIIMKDGSSFNIKIMFTR